MTHPSVLFVAQGKKCFIYHNIKWRPPFLELATTLIKAKWLTKKKLILYPVWVPAVSPIACTVHRGNSQEQK